MTPEEHDQLEWLLDKLLVMNARLHDGNRAQWYDNATSIDSVKGISRQFRK